MCGGRGCGVRALIVLADHASGGEELLEVCLEKSVKAIVMPPCGVSNDPSYWAEVAGNLCENYWVIILPMAMWDDWLSTRGINAESFARIFPAADKVIWLHRESKWAQAIAYMDRLGQLGDQYKEPRTPANVWRWAKDMSKESWDAYRAFLMVMGISWEDAVEARPWAVNAFAGTPVAGIFEDWRQKLKSGWTDDLQQEFQRMSLIFNACILSGQKDVL